MAQAKDVILAQLATAEFLFTQLTTDMSDDEYFKVPVAGANHPAWLVGHVAVSNDRMSAAACGTDPKTSQATQELFMAGSTCHDDPSKYPSRAEIDALFRDTQALTVERLKGFDDSKWEDPSPEGWNKEFFPTLGTLWTLIGTHPFWHVGHLTVCRKVLGKKGILG